MKVAGVYIERDRVYVTIEDISDVTAGMYPPVPVKAINGTVFLIKNPDDTEGGQACLKYIALSIARMAPDVSGIGIASYGPFKSLGPPLSNALPSQTSRVPDYGRLHDESDRPFNGANIVQIFEEPFGINPPVILVQTDANVMAIGEAWHGELQRDDVLVSVILNKAGLGGGIITGDRLSGGMLPNVLGHLHPEMGMAQVSRRSDDPIKREGVGLDYESNVGDLASMEATRQRANILGIPLEDDSLEALMKASHPKLWPITAYYMAQLCWSCASMLSPKKIVISGPILKVRANYESSDIKFLIEMVRKEFQHFRDARKNLSTSKSGGRVGAAFAYAHMDNPDFISSSTKNRLFSELAGCVYLAIIATRLHRGPRVI